jgi:cofilin
VNAECAKEYLNLQRKRLYRYIIFAINSESTEIIVEAKEEVKPAEEEDEKAWREEYTNFAGRLPEKQCRWVVYDFKYLVEGARRNKIIFINWQVFTLIPWPAVLTHATLFSSSSH